MSIRNNMIEKKVLKIFSVSLGCPKNRVDTERVLGALGLDVRFVEHLGRADLVFINTCGFIQPAVEESVSVVVDAVKRIASFRKKPFLVVAGCLVGRYGQEELAKELPEVDLWLNSRETEVWAAILTSALGLKQAAEHRAVSTPPGYAWLKISEGCGHGCTFCTIPAIRGPHRSTPVEALAREAESLLAGGAKEIILVGQDITAYGADIGLKRGLVPLLERLSALPGITWLRLLYMYPAGISKDLLDFMHEAQNVVLPYFDVPAQHAHSAILGKMGRPFARDPRAAIDRIRDVFPEAALRTSLIVGFPGETEEHFKELCAFVSQTRFTNLGVFAYKREEGSAAAEMPDQVAEDLKEERHAIIMEMQAEISEENMASFVGQRLAVLVDEASPEWPGLHVGRVWFQAPEIDGVTYVSGPGVTPGAMVEADIDDSKVYDLVALA